MKESILISSGAIDSVLQWRYDGKTLQEISQLLEKEKGIKMAYQSIWAVLKNIEKKNQVKEDAQEILYNNRKEVVRMKRDFYSNLGIANKFGVTEKDVEEFLSKRKKLSPWDYREIRKKYALGLSIEEIAEEYGINVKSAEQIVNKQKVITTSPAVMSKYEETQKEVVNKVYNTSIAKDFMDLIYTLKSKYDSAQKEVDNYNNLRNNIFHQLELESGTQEEKLQMLDKIKKISTDRRELKNFIETLEPLVNYLEDSTVKKVLINLGKIINDVINNEDRIKNRIYFIREEGE